MLPSFATTSHKSRRQILSQVTSASSNVQHTSLHTPPLHTVAKVGPKIPSAHSTTVSTLASTVTFSPTELETKLCDKSFHHASRAFLRLASRQATRFKQEETSHGNSFLMMGNRITFQFLSAVFLLILRIMSGRSYQINRGLFNSMRIIS